MGARLVVGNLNHRTTEKQLERFFSSWGTVVSVRIPRDRRTGRSRGFGFVELPNEELAELALAVFNGRQLGGRVLRLRSADPPDGSSNQDSGRYDRRPSQARETWQTAPGGSGDYARDRGPRRRKGGKHGSDRKRGRGTRRVIT